MKGLRLAQRQAVTRVKAAGVCPRGSRGEVSDLRPAGGVGGLAPGMGAGDATRRADVGADQGASARRRRSADRESLDGRLTREAPHQRGHLRRCFPTRRLPSASARLGYNR